MSDYFNRFAAFLFIFCRILNLKTISMKRHFLLIAASLFFSHLFAQLGNTRWKTTLQINGPVNAIFEFKKDIALVYTVADSTVIETMSFSTDDSAVTLVKTDGQSDCDGSTPGRYHYKLTGDSMFLTLVKDDCPDRSSVIENTRWEKWIFYPGIKVNENILKQYTGVFGVDAAHPITITLENGVLYAEGPNNGLPKSSFVAITPSSFLLKIAGVKMDFVKDKTGSVTKIISHEGKDIDLPRIK